MAPPDDLLPRFDDDGCLIGHDGARHPKLTWRSSLERKLIFSTRFPARARTISAAFERWLTKDRTSDAERADLAAWVIDAAPYLGSGGIDHAAELVSRFPALASFAAREAAALAGFLAEVADPPSRAADPPLPPRRRVAVLFSELGGGTGTVTEAIVELLRETPDLEPIPLSIHADVQGSDSPFRRVFGITEADAWNRALDEGIERGGLERIRKARAALRRCFLPDAVEATARLVAESGAHHVLCTLPAYPQLAQLATVRRPLTLLHADFGVNATLSGEDDGEAPPLHRLLDPDRVTIGLASSDPEPPLDAMRASLGARFDRLVRVIGYPVRRAFSRPAKGAELDRLRADLGVSADERVVLLMMGRSGMGDRLIHLARALFDRPPEAAPRLHVVAVCGGSERSRRALEDARARAPSAARVRVTGMLRAEEIAGYMHLAAAPGPARGGVVVTKPGGATTGECAEAGAFMLLFPGLPWEEKNRRFAVSRGLGEDCSEEGFGAALARCLAEPPTPYSPPLDWRARLLSHLRGFPP